MNKMILSHFQAKVLFEALKKGKNKILCSLDLGITQTEIFLNEFGAKINDDKFISTGVLKKIIKNRNNCFYFENGELEKIKGFSKNTKRAYSLFPTIRAPSMIISGFVMHRIKDSDPWSDSINKINAIGTIRGNVLDTATGLGYTAILSSKKALKVDTIELDPMSIEMAKKNPWSKELFSNTNITQHFGDSFEAINSFENSYFDVVIHDPPSPALAPHLYSLDFYNSIQRVLTKKGKLFHYIGNPDSTLGKSTTTSVIKKLKEAGFKKIERKPEAFGILAFM